MLAEYANPFAERLAGVYLHRLPENAILEQLSFTLIAEDGEQLDAPVEARHALLLLKKARRWSSPPSGSGRGRLCWSSWSTAPRCRGASWRRASR